MFFWLMTGKFYTLGIMRSLNSRPGLRGWMTSDDMGRTSLSDWQWADEHENSVARRPSEVRFPVQYNVRVISRLKTCCAAVAQTPFLETASISRAQGLYTLPESGSTASVPE